METRIITVTLRGAAADKLRKAVEHKKDEHRRIDWTGYSPLLKK